MGITLLLYDTALIQAIRIHSTGTETPRFVTSRAVTSGRRIHAITWPKLPVVDWCLLIKQIRLMTDFTCKSTAGVTWFAANGLRYTHAENI